MTSSLLVGFRFFLLSSLLYLCCISHDFIATIRSCYATYDMNSDPTHAKEEVERLPADDSDLENGERDGHRNDSSKS